MKHLGDITKINGAEVEPVEVIIGGSPCQDLSVAGKRAGLDGERSGLFMEQIRIIKEMRENDRANGRTDDAIRPRYMVWENVPGAFSSNKGEDFRIVLEETAKIADPEISIPRPPRGKWTNAGVIMGRGYSIAWRVLDAQFFGVPQRRRRIALVADFGGQSAPEILFKSESLSGNIEQSGTQRERTAADAESCTDKTICYGISAYESNAMKSSNPHSGVYEADTSRILDNNGGNPACNQGGIAVVYRKKRHPQNAEQGQEWEQTETSDTLNIFDNSEGRTPTVVVDMGGGKSKCGVTEGVTPTLATTHGGEPVVYDARGNGNGELAPTINGDHQNRVTDYTALCIENGQADQTGLHEIAGTLNCMHDQQAVMIKEENDATGTQDQVLRILQETYGEKAVVEWGVAILATLQSAKVLQQGMYDSCDERETENGNELDDGSLPRSELVAGWLLRDMREQSKRRCSSQGQQSEEQRNQQSSKAVQVVSYQSTQNCKEMFNMWRKGQGLGVLRQALSKIQETRKPSCSKEKRSYYTVRRLTPLETERLQGYPDHWTDIGEWTDSKGKKHKDADSPRYKALGNSIAIPCWRFILQRISERVKEHTMASLFDGISGFCLIWYELGGDIRFVSEIEEYPIAVCKRHFGDEKTGQIGDIENYVKR